MANGIQLNASLILYPDDEMDAEILDWLDSLPRRKESGSSRERVCRRGITREFRQALCEYAQRQNSRKAIRGGKRDAMQDNLQAGPSPAVPASAVPVAAVPAPAASQPSPPSSPLAGQPSVRVDSLPVDRPAGSSQRAGGVVGVRF